MNDDLFESHPHADTRIPQVAGDTAQSTGTIVQDRPPQVGHHAGSGELEGTLPSNGIPQLALQERRRNELPVVPDYELVRKLGEGGEGQVFEAIRASTGEHVALKIINRQDYREDDREFHHHRALSDHLANHMRGDGSPFTTISDSGKLGDGRHFLVMNLVDGDRVWRSTIDKTFERTTPGEQPDLKVSLSEYISVFEETVRTSFFFAGVLHKVHRLGLVHRDIKPDNMSFGRAMSTIAIPGDPSSDFDSRPFDANMSYENDSDMEATDFRDSVLLDTGVMARWMAIGGVEERAKADRDSEQPLRMTRDFKKFHDTIPLATDSTTGTRAYMGTECFRGESGPWSDQFAFGVALFEMLTGFNPRRASGADQAAPMPSLWDALPAEFKEKLKDPNFKVMGMEGTSVVYLLSEAISQATAPEYADRHRHMGQLADILSDCVQQDRVVRQTLPQSIRAELIRREREAAAAV